MAHVCAISISVSPSLSGRWVDFNASPICVSSMPVCMRKCMYIFISVCVCVCVCARASVSERGWQTDGERGYAFTHRHRCNTSIYMDIHKHRCAHDYDAATRMHMPHSTYSHACMHAYAHTHMHTHVNAHAQTHRPAYDCTCTFPQVFEPISDQRGAGKVGGMSRRCNHVSKASPGLVQILLQVCARFSCVSVYACTYKRAYVCVCVCVCVHTYIYTCDVYMCNTSHMC